MFFDDRLATVLRHRAAGENAARTQFRQLLDLLGNRKYGRDESLVAAAWLRLGALGEMIPSAERARMVAEPGWRFRSPELAAHLAEDEPEVAAAALSRADLTEDDWEALIPRLPIRARGFLRLRRDLPEGAEAILERLGIRDRGLPQPEPLELEELAEEVPGLDNAVEEAPAEPVDIAEPVLETGELPEVVPEEISAQATTHDDEKSEISALVERIAQFRRDRETAPPPSDEFSPRLPLDEQPRATERAFAGFAFAADAAGRIEWADASVAPMVIGKRLVATRRLGDGALPNPLAMAFARQQPIEGALIALEGAPGIAGDWIVDAQPRFARSGGRFHGYVGRFRRPATEDAAQKRRAEEADRIRQLLHELRTPVNALQGFAEVIQQQLFGPAPNEYRALAATIAGDAARILAGFDELERLAKLESGALQPGQGEANVVAIVERMVHQLEQVLSPRMSGFELVATPEKAPLAAFDSDEAEAMLWRLFATLAGACTAGEELGIEIEAGDDEVLIACDLPAQLMAEEDVFAAEAKPVSTGISSGLFGAGFSLRLARAEARAAGGLLLHEDDRVLLTLPLLTDQQTLPSQDDNTRSKAGLAEG